MVRYNKPRVGLGIGLVIVCVQIVKRLFSFGFYVFSIGTYVERRGRPQLLEIPRMNQPTEQGATDTSDKNFEY